MLYKLGFQPSKKRNSETEEGYLDSVLASTVFDLDASIPDSYNKTESYWCNLVANPADGSTQTTYDFILGRTTSETENDPVHVEDGKASYWYMGGNQWFTIKEAQSNFIKKAHRTDLGGSFWLALSMRMPSEYLYSDRLFGAGVSGVQGGVQIIRTDVGGLMFLITGNSNAATIDMIESIPEETDCLIIISYDGATNSFRCWTNSRTADYDGPVSTPPQTRSEDILGRFSLGAVTIHGEIYGIMDDTTRIYTFAMGNEFIDDSKATKIIRHLNKRHGRVYA